MSRDEALIALRERIAHPERFLTARKNEQRVTHAARVVLNYFESTLEGTSIESKETIQQQAIDLTRAILSR